MTPAQINFEIGWQKEYALRALFSDNKDVAFELFKTVWNSAVDESAAIARNQGINIPQSILELRHD